MFQEYETFKNQHSKCDETLLMAENKIEASNLYANQLQVDFVLIQSMQCILNIIWSAKSGVSNINI